jgi:putative transcriptional regulator
VWLGALVCAGVSTVAAPAGTQPGREVIVRQLAAGTMLVAARNLPDPNFSDTVVLLIEYGPGGAAGLVLTRPSEVPLARVLPDLAPVTSDGARVFIGGPVSPGTVIALSRGACDGCREVTRGVSLVSDGAVLRERIAAGADDRRLRVYAGYAGWSAEQLEREVRQHVWRVIDGDASIVFDDDPLTLWRRMLARAESVLASSAPVGLPGTVAP